MSSKFSNPDFLQDDIAYSDLYRDQEELVYMQNFNKNKHQPRTGVVVSSLTTADIERLRLATGELAPVKIRTSGSIDGCMPYPCDKTFTPDQNKQLKTCHPTAYPVKGLEDGEVIPTWGMTVLVHNTSGPLRKGQNRGIRYEYPSHGDQYDYECASGELVAHERLFKSANLLGKRNKNTLTTITDTGAPEECKTKPRFVNKERKFTWEELGKIYIALEPLMTFIAKHEGSYNSVNRGRAGDSPGGSKKYWGKNLTDMTVREVRCSQKDKRCAGKKGIFLAVGKYQFIYQTLGPAVTSTGVDQNLKFNKDTQDKLAAYLLLQKADKQMISHYLLGNHNNACYAAQDLAYEFASMPLQFKSSNSRHGRGASNYKNDSAGNAALTDPVSVYNKVVEARRGIANNPEIIELFRSKGYLQRGNAYE